VLVVSSLENLLIHKSLLYAGMCGVKCGFAPFDFPPCAKTTQQGEDHGTGTEKRSKSQPPLEMVIWRLNVSALWPMPI